MVVERAEVRGEEEGGSERRWGKRKKENGE